MNTIDPVAVATLLQSNGINPNDIDENKLRKIIKENPDVLNGILPPETIASMTLNVAPEAAKENPLSNFSDEQYQQLPDGIKKTFEDAKEEIEDLRQDNEKLKKQLQQVLSKNIALELKLAMQTNGLNSNLNGKKANESVRVSVSDMSFMTAFMTLLSLFL